MSGQKCVVVVVTSFGLRSDQDVEESVKYTYSRNVVLSRRLPWLLEQLPILLHVPKLHVIFDLPACFAKATVIGQVQFQESVESNDRWSSTPISYCVSELRYINVVFVLTGAFWREHHSRNRQDVHHRIRMPLYKQLFPCF